MFQQKKAGREQNDMLKFLKGEEKEKERKEGREGGREGRKKKLYPAKLSRKKKRVFPR
jgi:hypothetical protein